MENKNECKRELLMMFDGALEDARTLWLSDYCNSTEEEKRRIQEDKEFRERFIELLSNL